jgi:hypothetical protein
MLLCTWVDTHYCFGLVQQLDRRGSGWQPRSKIGEAGEPRRTVALAESNGLQVAGGSGGAQEHKEAVGD